MKGCLHLHDDALDTTAHGVPYDSVAPLPPSRRCVWRVATTLWFTFLYFLSLVHFSLVYFRIHTIFFRPGHDLRSSIHLKRKRR